jgi:hypothetical protein
VSTDNGVTWAIRTVPGSATQDESDPAVGVGSGNTMYFGFQQAATQKGVNETYPGVAVSHDRGATFTNVNLNLGSGLGIRNVQFPTLIAGDDNRAALSFLGTTTGGDDQASTFAGVWHLYVATTYDGGATWSTVQATPSADPVQRGCIWLGGGDNACRNLLDFIGSTVDRSGRVLVGYADGCNDTCASGGKNNWGADATLARQTSGNGQFAAYDGGAGGGSASPSPSPSQTAAATVPTAPLNLAAAGAKGKGVQLSWSAPSSDGGAPVTSYTVYRSTGGGAEQAVATVSAASYKDTATTKGATYTYTVTATNSAGESPHSSPVGATAS